MEHVDEAGVMLLGTKEYVFEWNLSGFLLLKAIFPRQKRFGDCFVQKKGGFQSEPVSNWGKESVVGENQTDRSVYA